MRRQLNPWRSRVLVVGLTLCASATARAQATPAATVTAAPIIIEPDQTRPKRPLVLDDGVADLHIGLGFSISGEPEFSMADFVYLPIGADFGLGDTFEVGGLLNIAMQPEVASTLTARARVNLGLPDKMLALGVAFTIPSFWESTNRFGPYRALPLTFELPAFRVEGSSAAFQAVLRWAYTIQEGPDGKALTPAMAGVFRINQAAFAHADLGTSLANLETDNMNIFAGLGLGYAVTPNFIGKFQVQTGDLAGFSQWEMIFMVVNTSGQERESRDSEWN
jgi:hypothetical protein